MFYAEIHTRACIHSPEARVHNIYRYYELLPEVTWKHFNGLHFPGKVP